jgi:O-antigen biosynthesis protein
MDQAKRILCYAWNGIGAGHLTRLTSIARALRELSHQNSLKTDIWMITTSEATKIAFSEQFPTFKFPSLPIPGFFREWHRDLCQALVRQSLELLKPDLIIVDTLPQGFYDELRDLIPTIPKKVFVYRPSHAAYSESQGFFQRLEPYDLILVPERQSDANLVVPQHLQSKVRFLGPVMIRRREEILSHDEARTKLGAAPGQKIVYLSAGGGGGKGAEKMLHDWLNWLSGTEYLLVVGAGPLYRGDVRYDRNVLWTERVPICEFMAGFDVAVSAAGYNSFNELMYFGVPTILVPQKRDADDQLARARRAEQQGAAFLLESPDAVSLANAVARVSDAGETMRQKAQQIYNKNYAADFAAAIYDLLTEQRQGAVTDETEPEKPQRSAFQRAKEQAAQEREMQNEIRIDSLELKAALADEQDVWSLYNLVLRRDPESHQAMRDKMGKPVHEIFAECLNSPEFQQDVLPIILNKASGDVAYRGTQSFGQLLTWAESRLSLPSELRNRLIYTRSWVQFDEALFTNPWLLERFPHIRDSGVNRVLEVRQLESGTAPSRDLRGDIDYANIWEVKGWCADPKNLQEKRTVDIFVDDDLLGSAICQAYRRDIQEKLGGDGGYGFTFIMPAAAQDSFQTERRLTIRERSSGLTIGNPIYLRGNIPKRVEAIDAMREEFIQAKDTIAKLESQLAQLTANIGYPIQAYDEYAHTFDAVTPDFVAECRQNLTTFTGHPKISIVLMTEPDCQGLLGASLRSIHEQIYTKWELVLVGAEGVSTPAELLSSLPEPDLDVRWRFFEEPADVGTMMREGLALCKGSFVLFLRAGDRLASDALYHNVVQIRQPGVKAVYADEDCYNFGDHGHLRRHSPRLKPCFDADYLLSENYIGRFVLFERDAVVRIGGPRSEIPDAEEFDLVLRLIEALGTEGIVHVPQVIYHRYQPDKALTLERASGLAIQRAVNGHLVRSGLPATAEPHCDVLGSSRPSAVRLRWSLPEPAPSVSLIIPSKDHPEHIGPCTSSLLATTKSYVGPIEILVVDNGTSDTVAGTLLKTLEANGNIRITSYPDEFNWSGMNNEAADQARGDILIFLNNDTLAMSEGWIEELVSQAMRPEIGAVGARLLFPDDTIQHAGIVLGVGGSSCHEAIGQPVAAGGYLGRSHVQHRVSAVTGACLATRKDVFRRVKGFDEIMFKITYNDIDYCLKVAAAGFGVIYTPFATLYHFESASRGFDSTHHAGNDADEELAALRARWPRAVQKDPFYNPHFSRAGLPFTYLSASRRSGVRPD